MGILPPGDYELGQDVSDILGVRKWEIAEYASSNGTIIGELPDGVVKTDETRIQAEPRLLDEFAGLPYYITTKLDGTSVSMFRIDGRFGVCGHILKASDGNPFAGGWYNGAQALGQQGRSDTDVEQP